MRTKFPSHIVIYYKTSFINQIMQRLFVHLNSPLKLLVSVLNLILDNRVNFLVAFKLKLCYYFLIYSLRHLIVYH